MVGIVQGIAELAFLVLLLKENAVQNPLVAAAISSQLPATHSKATNRMLYQGWNPAFRTALFLLATALTLSAQTPSAQTPSLRSTTQLVEIDTVVADAHGKPVMDLKAEDFKLFEDGKERPLAHFSFEKVEPSDPRAAQHLRELAQKQKPGVYANFTAETAVVPPNGCTVLLIDWLNTPLELQPEAFQEIRNFIATVDLSKPLEIFSLDSSLHLVQSFTTDRQALRSSIEKYGPRNANLQPEKRATHTLDSELNDFRVAKTVAAFQAIGGSVRGMQGHKSLLWLSGSFPAALIPTDLTGLNPDMEGNYGGYIYGDRRNYSGLMTQVFQILSAENIAVYPVDAQGLQGSMTDSSQFSFRFYTNPIYQANYERQESMRGIADQTDGRAFYNHNDIGSELASAYNDANTFYALAFTPAKNKPDGKMHSVRVQCRRSGVHLRYRLSYFAEIKQDSAKAKRTELESLASTLGRTADGLPFMAQIDKQQNDRLKLWLDGNALSIIGGQQPFLNVDIGVATFDDHGNLLQQNYSPVKIKMSLNQFQEVQTSGLSQTLQFARSKESARVRIAVRDLTSGRVGTLEVPLQ
jgi:VWFA-related protein